MQWEIENDRLGFLREEQAQLNYAMKQLDRLLPSSSDLENVFMFRISPSSGPPEVRSLRRPLEDVLTLA